MQLCTNTQQYNEDGSLIFEVFFSKISIVFSLNFLPYSIDQICSDLPSKILLCVLTEFVQDSIVLQSVFTNARERLEQVEADSEEEDERFY